MSNFSNLKTLVVMQLKDKLDLSQSRSLRKKFFKIAGLVIQVALSSVAFFIFFMLAQRLKIFSFSGLVPATLVTAMYTLIFTLGVVTCTAGLTQALYLSEDNRVLLTLPVQTNMVFMSKFVLYFIFELKKNLTLLLPMYVAYGIVCHAVWYFYPWLIVCYFFVSLLPVAIAAVLSIPALYVSNVIRRFKWLQLILIVAITGLVTWGIFSLINLLPENINIAGRWGTISLTVQKFLATFAGWVKPLDWINLMIMGGTSQIRGKLFTMNTLWGWLITIGTIIVCIAFAFLVARPLFFKMAASQFEFEKGQKRTKKNRKVNSKLAPLFYETMRSFRSGKYIFQTIICLFLLPLAVFFLNKVYAAMNTRLTGQYMTLTFSLLISLLIVTSQNATYASVYSVDGHARTLAKTQPISPQISLVSRLLPRILTILVSTVFATCLWQNVAKLTTNTTTMLTLTILFVGWAHLLWCAEMDIMRPQHEQYATLGLSYDNPNERNATIAAFILSIALSYFNYKILPEGQEKAVLKLAAIAFVFLLVRVFLYFTRIRLYYAEK